MSAERGEAAEPRKLAAREVGATLLSRLSVMLRIGRSYQTDNQVFLTQLGEFEQVLLRVLDAEGEAVLVSLDGDLFLNGTRIPVRGMNVRFHRHVMEEFQRRQIAGFRALRGIASEELRTFFRLFLQPEVYAGPDLLTACIGEGLDKMLPAVHASTSSPDLSFTPDVVGPVESEPAEPEWATPPEPLPDPTDPAEARPGPGQAAPRGAAPKTYSAAVAGARSLLTTTSLQGGLELRHAKRVVQPLVDGAFASEPVVIGLSSLTHHDEFTYAHAVNVTLIAVTMGHFLEMDRRALADLGVAALLHDVGKAAVSERIKNPMDAFTAEEEELARRHPLEGVKTLARSTTLNPTTLRCMKVALEHHLGPDGSGFPDLPGWHTSLLSRIVAVADCFVSLQMHRSRRGAHVTPFEALGMMLGPLRSRFHPAMLWALVQTVGFYPPGQLVELDDGTIALVLAPNPSDLARPNVRPLIRPDGRLHEEAEDLKPLPPERSVRRALRGAEYPREPRAAA